MRVLIFGSAGMLGAELQKQWQAKGAEVFAFDRELDITDQKQVDTKLQELRPEIVFNCAAYNAVDKAEDQADIATKINADAIAYIAAAAEKIGAVVVHYSSGFVFDGEKSQGYNEDDLPNPQSVYARSKYQGEKNLQATAAKYYLIRLNLLFGEQGKSAGSKKSFPAVILDLAKTKDSFDFVTDEISTPTYAPDLAEASIALVEKKYPFGIYHIVNEGRASWYDWAKEILELKGIQAKINPVSASAFPRKASRPACSVLINNKFPKLRGWQQATAEFLKKT